MIPADRVAEGSERRSLLLRGSLKLDGTEHGYAAFATLCLPRDDPGVAFPRRKRRVQRDYHSVRRACDPKRPTRLRPFAAMDEVDLVVRVPRQFRQTDDAERERRVATSGAPHLEPCAGAGRNRGATEDDRPDHGVAGSISAPLVSQRVAQAEDGSDREHAYEKEVQAAPARAP